MREPDPVTPRMEGNTFVFPVRIYYEDTDLSGIVYHANYLRYMERARTEFFRFLGLKAAAMEDADPSAWALRKLEIDYLRPAKFDDIVEVRTNVVALSAARLIAQQSIYAHGVQLTRGQVEACIISLTGRPKRIPQEVRDKVLPFVSETVA
ncbi:acyl-CoA thioester hydrolase [Rhizomicrobium palustre]|uniref:Acyl-CoA thioester hydrolase n=1 Tax=Rhizomicrobium palustre TaxID=189966 RepID=A0A846MYN2_9PROT|nr:tol-pal system-associated acyl-CoA thioesterase [Rhizomicrobium palustre]NIK88738.1 acyl-CoA thioester hydrolase [Rhizomicrobium palustre]